MSYSATYSAVLSQTLLQIFQRELKLTIEIQANAFLNVEERTLPIELNLLFFRSTSEGEGFPALKSSVPALLDTVKKYWPESSWINISDLTAASTAPEGGTVTLVLCLQSARHLWGLLHADGAQLMSRNHKKAERPRATVPLISH